VPCARWLASEAQLDDDQRHQSFSQIAHPPAAQAEDFPYRRMLDGIACSLLQHSNSDIHTTFHAFSGS
jgi:hypothetical protein